jgi:hypothetical protein
MMKLFVFINVQSSMIPAHTVEMGHTKFIG